ncbi:nucleoside-diphosphate-sugar epimerase [Phlyctema vagabunda]|uniref:Nucleoside-diphosphate-sugar epimerase n=1 Tax=Phlyctema vagabunda TaxID=108571 RepID=A0ABR4PNV9_9HELO
MTPKNLFITGATGFIGGSVLEKIVHTHPELEITALLRSPSDVFKTTYPKVKIQLGDFDAFEVIEKASYETDIVIHTGDIDHPGCVAAILSGLKKKMTPSFLIHLTGTGCISDELTQSWEGETNPYIWDDIRDIEKIYNLPDEALHHTVDREIMDASNQLLKTAIICPPDIYGQHRGTGTRATFMVPEYIKVLQKHKEAFYLGHGQNYRAVTHIDDVVQMFVTLLDQAVQGGGRAQWGKEGFYFTVADEVRWIDAAEAINEIAIRQGWLPAGNKPVSWTKEQLGSLMPSFPRLVLYLWGSNSRAVSERAKKLGWKPQAPSFWEALEEDVKIAGDSKVPSALM